MNQLFYFIFAFFFMFLGYYLGRLSNRITSKGKKNLRFDKQHSKDRPIVHYSKAMPISKYWREDFNRRWAAVLKKD